MKRSQTPEGQSRFSTPVRHYHRADSRPRRTWDQWVEGGNFKPRVTQSRLKILGIILALLALAGIIAGLVIELR